MKRLVYIISTFLILTGMYGGIVGADNIFKFFQTGGSAAIDIIGGKFHGNHMPDSHKTKYLRWVQERHGYVWDTALAVAPTGRANGLWIS